MISIKEVEINGNVVSLYTHDGYFYVHVRNKEKGFYGQPEQHIEVEDAVKEFEKIVQFIASVT